jgi:hypothetical protein
MTLALPLGLGRRLRRLWRREDGTATIEFVIFVPVVINIFMASVEAGFYMIRHVMLERGVDMVMREFRLGHLGAVNHDDLRDMICDATPIMGECQNILKISLQPIDTSSSTWAMPTAPATCVDRGEEIQPPSTYSTGASGELMVIRVCAIQDPIFPTTGIGLELRSDSLGGYQLVAATVFVIEPS